MKLSKNEKSDITVKLIPPIKYNDNLFKFIRG